MTTTRKRGVELWPGANELPWEQDDIAQDICAEFGPLTLHEIGFCMGLSRERVRQIEESAMRKIACRSARNGLAKIIKAQLVESETLRSKRERTLPETVDVGDARVLHKCLGIRGA